jgi:hypothetical protein
MFPRNWLNQGRYRKPPSANFRFSSKCFWQERKKRSDPNGATASTEKPAINNETLTQWIQEFYREAIPLGDANL